MDVELSERVLECLRGCDIGESISADGIADEIGTRLGNVYDALEEMENARLVEMHPSCRKGSDPTYTLTPKGRRYLQHDAKTPEPETIVEERADPEPRPSADRVCRFCGKIMEPNKVRRHENLCGKNPDSVSNAARRKAAKEEVLETNATHALDFEVPMEGCADPPEESDFPAFPEALEQLNTDDPDMPDEVPDYSPANNAADRDTLLAGFLERVRAQDALVLKGSPGMDAALRLISFCQQMVGSGAQVSVDATVQVTEGFHIHVDLCVPAGESDE